MTDENRILADVDAELVIRRYQQRILLHGPTLASLNSGSAEKQWIRHGVHAEILRGVCPSLLDVGCGLGSFCEYLRAKNRACDYTGYDIVPEYVDYCRQQFGERCRFEKRNIFAQGIDGSFDHIVMSQVLNNRYQASDNLQVMKAALACAFAHSIVSVSVDMLSSYVDFCEPELYYYSPEHVFAFAKTLTRRVVLRHDYRPFEFCIQLFHDAPPDDTQT